METFGKRLARYLLLNQGNQSDLARFIGVSPQAVQQWMAGETTPRGAHLERAAAFFNISPAELRFGSPEKPQTPSWLIQTPRRIPLISTVQAGLWTEICDAYQPGDGSDWLLTDLPLSPNAFALTIKGDSMMPEFSEGDRVIIDPAVQPNPGNFVAAKNTKDEATFKKYRPRGINEQGLDIIELIPLNPDYPTIRSDLTPLTIIGTMVEHRRYRKG